MRHLTKPRDRGYSFRMVTPVILIGTKNPWTGKPFGKEIKLGLGTRVHAEALRQRDVCLGQVRQLEDEARRAKGRGGSGRILDLSHDSALEWQDLRASTDDLDGVDHVLTNELDRAARAGHEEEAERFAAVVFRGAVAISKAVELYLEERSEGNPYGFDPLARTTALNVQSTVKHLIAFLGGDQPTLQDVTPKKAFDFRMNYLPVVVGLQPATVNKHMTLLKGLWAWAITDKRYLQSRNGKPTGVSTSTVANMRNVKEQLKGEVEMPLDWAQARALARAKGHQPIELTEDEREELIKARAKALDDKVGKLIGDMGERQLEAVRMMLEWRLGQKTAFLADYWREDEDTDLPF